mgnify:CR=1 FL=1
MNKYSSTIKAFVSIAEALFRILNEALIKSENTRQYDQKISQLKFQNNIIEN